MRPVFSSIVPEFMFFHFTSYFKNKFARFEQILVFLAQLRDRAKYGATNLAQIDSFVTEGLTRICGLSPPLLCALERAE